MDSVVKPQASQAAYIDAEHRVDQAIERLEASLRSLNGRVRSLDRIEEEVAQLEQDRARLTRELAHVTQKARKLDVASADVSRRLVDAMEHVRAISDAQKN